MMKSFESGAQLDNLDNLAQLVWVDPSFNLKSFVEAIDTPIVEVGGPVIGDERAYSIIPKDIQLILDEKKIDVGYFVSNINTQWHEEVMGIKPKLDFQADARQMPIKDGYLSMVFASCLGEGIRKDTIVEAYRMLKDGGLLVWNGAFVSDVVYATDAGFDVVAYAWEPIAGPILASVFAENADLDFESTQNAVAQRVKDFVNHDDANVANFAKQCVDRPSTCVPRQFIFRKPN